MRYLTIQAFRKNTAQIRKDLQKELGIILTSRGKPFALMASVSPDRLAEEVAAYRHQRAPMLCEQTDADAKAKGTRRWTMREIEAEIARARAERRAEEEKPKTRKGTTAKHAN